MAYQTICLRSVDTDLPREMIVFAAQPLMLEVRTGRVPARRDVCQSALPTATSTKTAVWETRAGTIELQEQVPKS